MKHFLLLFLGALLFTATTRAQDIDATSISLGYADFDATYTVDITTLGSSWGGEVGFTFSTVTDTDELGFGLRLGLPIMLHKTRESALYIAPRFGYRTVPDNIDTDIDGADGIHYEGAIGFKTYPIQLSLGYGFDDITQSEYVSFTIGLWGIFQ